MTLAARIFQRALNEKLAFVPLGTAGAKLGQQAPGPGGAPMDPAMGGAPPAPPMDPAMAGGMPPPSMDPAMGGMPPIWRPISRSAEKTCATCKSVFPNSGFPLWGVVKAM